MADQSGAIELNVATRSRLGSGNSHEMLRAWITHDGPSTIIINATLIPPNMFGMLIADCARHASIAYAAADGSLSEKQARELILDALWAELGDPTTDLTTLDSGGRQN